MIPAQWTIESPAFPARTFADLGLSDLKISKKHAAVSSAVFRANGKYDAGYLWPYKTVCTIRKDGALWFVGSLSKIIPQGSGEREGIGYELSDAWWELERTPYQQLGWFNGATAWTPMIALGYEGDAEGQNFGQLTTGAQITRILNYAISQCNPGVDLIIGAIDNGLIMPTSESRAETCARLIRTVLQYCVDGIIAIDYTTNPKPTINLTPRSSAKVVTYHIPKRLVESVNLVPRYDLQVPCAALYYIQTNRTDGNSEVTQTPDIYPPGSNPQQVGAFVDALTLDGSDVKTQKQQVQATAIPSGGQQGGALSAWVQSKVPGLKPLTLANLGFGPQPNEYSKVDPNQKDCNGNPINNFQGPGNNGGLQYLQNELTLGTVPPWLAAPVGTGQTVPGDGAKHLVMVTMHYLVTYNGVPASIDEARFFQKKFMDKFGNVQPCWEEFTIRATDIPAGDLQTYEKPVSIIYGEPIPQGFAKYLFQKLGMLHFEGEVPIVESECDGVPQVGNVLNIIGGRPEWENMLAQINEVTEEIDSGRTTVKVGPPTVFSAADLLAMMRARRTTNALGWSCPSTSREGRSKGSNDETNAASDGIGHTPWHQGGTGAGETAARDNFGILIQPHPSQPGVWQYGVTYCSKLLSNDDYSSIFTVHGLLTSNSPTPTDGGWITWNGGTSRLWLEINITGYDIDLSATYAQIQGDDIPGSDWGGGECEDDGGDGGNPTVYTQVFARLMIATITAGPCGQPIIANDIANRTLALRNRNMTGDSGYEIGALYPMPR